MKRCGKCGETKPSDEFWVDRRRGQPKSKCKACSIVDSRAWRKTKPEYERTRYQAVKNETRERHLVRKYGVSLATYDAMLKAQDGKCAICLAPEEAQFKGVFHVDHCHTTGKVRGLLCRGCNHILGTVKDNPETLQRAINYLAVPQVAAEVIAAYMEAYDA